MRRILNLAGREIQAAFTTPLAYVVISGFLLLSGFFFFSLLQQFNNLLSQAAMIQNIKPSLNDWVVKPYFQSIQVILVFMIPILTMRVVAEEKKMGTFELLLTSPLSISDIVLGKFIGASAVILLMLLLSFVYPLVLIVFADPEIMPIFIGLLGMILFTLAFTALGVAVSSATNSQTVAGVISVVLFLVFYVIDAPADNFGRYIAPVLRYLAPSNHAEAMLKGLLTAADPVYFLTVMLAGLFVANRVIETQRWR